MTVTVLMDPVGSIPVFLALTRHSPPAARNRAARRAALVAAGVILSFAVFGDLILRLLGIDLPALQVAGGLLLALVALELLHPFDDTPEPAAEDVPDVALVPLGTPLLAGPGAIAATMVYARNADDVWGGVTVGLALVASLLGTYVCLRFATTLSRVLRPNAIRVLSRVLGLLVAAVAVQLVADGVVAWMEQGVG